MAERERYEYYAGAVLVGVRWFAGVVVAVFAVTYGAAAVSVPVMRSWGWSVSRPGPASVGVVAAVLAGLAGWAAMHGARRLVAEGSAGVPGARALDLARRASAHGGGTGVPESRPVQRWSGDLLSRDHRVPLEAVTDAD